MRTEGQIFLKKRLIESYNVLTNPAVCEERVTLLYQDSFYHSRISDTQHGLTAIKNAAYHDSRRNKK